jgi:hypothetical protein
MVVLMCTAWLVLFALTILAFWKGKIFMAKEEDVIRDSTGLPDEHDIKATLHDAEKGSQVRRPDGHTSFSGPLDLEVPRPALVDLNARGTTQALALGGMGYDGQHGRF